MYMNEPSGKSLMNAVDHCDFPRSGLSELGSAYTRSSSGSALSIFEHHWTSSERTAKLETKIRFNVSRPTDSLGRNLNTRPPADICERASGESIAVIA